MYRRFKHGGKAEDKAVDHGTTGDEKQSEPEPDPDIVRQVAHVWKKVSDVCSESGGGSGQIVDNTAKDWTLSKFGVWQTVRIFVSSTFIDFFSEREVLVKKVFPELREWCQERRLKLVECDLRWGVPKDATSTQALLTCLEELDRCYQANAQPFFLCMLGERYGWIPEKEIVPAEVASKYCWVDESSMTFMEILYGALRISNKNAAFFMRDPGFISQLPEPHADRFKGESTLAKEHMKMLKAHLTQHYPDQVFAYRAQFGGLSDSTGRELVTLTGLETFADQVKEFFKMAIDRAYPQTDSRAQLSPEDKEQEMQWLFVKDKADSLIGRDAELQILLSYARGTPDKGLETIDGNDSTIRQTADWDVQEGDSQLCVVTAQGGWGKTTLLAALVIHAKKAGLEVFYHFVGSTATSGSHHTLLHRLLVALATKDDPELDPEVDTDSKKKHLSKLLTACREAQRQILIVLDGVNELDNSGSVYHLSWLPTALPSGVRCVVSANHSHLPTAARLYEHPAFHLPLQALDPSALTTLTQSFFMQYGKKLSAEQLQQVVQATKVDNPLWMTLLCEELRIFGDFRMMDNKLQALPDSMEAFLTMVVHRLITEDETGYVKKMLFLMMTSANGLPTQWILQLLGDSQRGTQCPMLYWAQARRVLKPYSRTVLSAQDATEYFTFVHEAMWKAVKQYMETSGEDPKCWHRQLADFFQYRCDSAVLRTSYLPRHLQMAGLGSRLVEFIRKDPHAMYLPDFKKSHYLREMRCRNPCAAVMPGTKEVMLCQSCYNRTGGFNPAMRRPNKDSCCLCSGFVFSRPGFECPARLCAFHASKTLVGPNIPKCCICSHVILNSSSISGDRKRHVGPGPALLCQHCGFGNAAQTCSTFKMNLS